MSNGEACETCEDVEEILRALRGSRLIKWEGVFDRRFLCPKCGFIPHWDVRRSQWSGEDALDFCCRCQSNVKEQAPEAEKSEPKQEP